MMVFWHRKPSLADDQAVAELLTLEMRASESRLVSTDRFQSSAHLYSTGSPERDLRTLCLATLPLRVGVHATPQFEANVIESPEVRFG